MTRILAKVVRAEPVILPGILQRLGIAVGTNAMAEGSFGMFRNIAIDLAPVPVVIPDFPAGRADGEYDGEEWARTNGANGAGGPVGGANLGVTPDGAGWFLL